MYYSVVCLEQRNRRQSVAPLSYIGIHRDLTRKTSVFLEALVLYRILKKGFIMLTTRSDYHNVCKQFGLSSNLEPQILGVLASSGFSYNDITSTLWT